MLLCIASLLHNTDRSLSTFHARTESVTVERGTHSAVQGSGDTGIQPCP
jgi:hypothetical protein